MKIGNLTLEWGSKVVGRAGKRVKYKDVLKQIKRTQLIRVSEDVGNWRNALNQAESTLNPDRTELIRIFKDIDLDNHLTSLVSTIKKRVKGSPFYVVDVKTGEIDEELTERFRKKWVRDLIGYIVEAPVWGFSVIQFEDIIGGDFSGVSLIPREYVIPEKNAVKRSLFITNTDLIHLDNPPFSKWTILVHEAGDMGLYNKAAPWALWKKGVVGAWAQAAEIFGMPLRVGKTDTNNPTAYSNMTKMLDEMGRAAYAVLDTDDEVDFTQITKTDFHNIYDRLCDRANSEMSKLILGQTMSSDDGSSRSQAEVHERVLDDWTTDSKTLVSDVFNDQVFPIMEALGILPSGKVFRHDNEEKIDVKTRFDMVIKIAKDIPGVTVPASYIEETFGIPLEEVEPLDIADPKEDGEGDGEGEDPKEPKAESVLPTVSNLYKGATAHKH